MGKKTLEDYQDTKQFILGMSTALAVAFLTTFGNFLAELNISTKAWTYGIVSFILAVAFWLSLNRFSQARADVDEIHIQQLKAENKHNRK